MTTMWLPFVVKNWRMRIRQALSAPFGTSVPAAMLGDNEYSRFVTREFDFVVPENDFKFANTRPGPGQFDFTLTDKAEEWAQAHGMGLHAHCLFWQNYLPDWVQGRDPTAIAQEHLGVMLTRYPGYSWDVVNEGYDNNGEPREGYWSGITGDYYDWISNALGRARMINSPGKLVYNDFELSPDAMIAYYNLAARGLVDAVGFQMHLAWWSELSLNLLRSIADDLHRHNVELWISEADVRLPMDERDRYHEVRLRHWLDLFGLVKSGHVDRFATWGAHDGVSWIPGTFPGLGDATLFTADMKPKDWTRKIVEALS